MKPQAEQAHIGIARSVDVTVLVPILNEERHLEQAAQAMSRQEFDGTVEFLLIDGGSDDRTHQIAETISARDSRFRVLSNPARRTPQALNIGLREARGRYVVRMDAHTIYPPDYIARGVARLERGDVAWVSGPQLARGDNGWSTRIAAALTSPLGFGGAAFRRNLTAEIETDTGFAGMARRDMVEALGGWDEGWPINQDGELAARIRKTGGRIVCVPQMAARYVPRESLPALWRQYFAYGQYRVKTSNRHPESMRPSQLLAPGLVLTLAGAAIPGPLGRLPRAAVAAYLAVTTVEAVRVSNSGLREVAPHAAVFPTMHLAWGLGFLRGCSRFGLPVQAVASAARRRLPRRA